MNTKLKNRNYIIVNLVKRGFILANVAEIFGITRERVRQIADKYDFLYDEDYTIPSKYNKYARKKSVLWEGKYYTIPQLIRKEFPDFPDSKIYSLESYLKAYSKNNNKPFINCFKEYLIKGDEMINKYLYVYKGHKYKTKKELLKKLFPNRDVYEVRSAIHQRMRYHGITYEEAIERTLSAPERRRRCRKR